MLSHYWGIKNDGEVKVRGIEVRCRDVPKIVKDVQYTFIDAFQGGKNAEEFKQRIPKSKSVLYRYIDKIEAGKAPSESLLQLLEPFSFKY